MCSALSQRVREEKFVAVDELKMDEFSTKAFVGVLSALKHEAGRVLVVIDQPDEKVYKSASNIPNVRMVTARNMNLLDLINYPKVIATDAAINTIQEVLG